MKKNLKEIKANEYKEQIIKIYFIIRKMLDYDSANLGSGSISFELWVKTNIFALIVILKNIIVVLDVISCPAEL